MENGDIDPEIDSGYYYYDEGVGAYPDRGAYIDATDPRSQQPGNSVSRAQDPRRRGGDPRAGVSDPRTRASDPTARLSDPRYASDPSPGQTVARGRGPTARQGELIPDSQPTRQVRLFYCDYSYDFNSVRTTLYTIT